MKRKTAWLQPGAPGLIVRDPVTLQALPPEGAEKPLTTYWRRRLRDHDAKRGQPPRKSQPAKARKEEG